MVVFPFAGMADPDTPFCHRLVGFYIYAPLQLNMELMHHNNYGHVDFNGTYGRRNPHTGRYMSNGMPDTTYGHSIKDRMVAALEPLYDKAESGYEHGMIQKAINSVQSLN